MSDPINDTSQHANLPAAVAAPRARGPLALVWLVPIVALLIGGWLAVKTILERGPTITVVFNQAEGLEAGKTRVKYKNVDVGLVSRIDLSADLKQVIVTAEMRKDFAPHLVADTTFWVTRARVSGGNVQALGTLISGAYIGVDVGKSSQPQRRFVGLDTPPVIQIDSPGREFTLRGEDLGSLEVGSPILFRRLQVGQIKSHSLAEDGGSILFTLFVHAPYDRFVTTNTRFWNASGIDLSLDASGVRLNTQSLASIITGGIAFEDPAPQAAWPAAAAAHEFQLFTTRQAALKNPESKIFRLAMAFDESVRGLQPGAPVDFRGIEVGEVIDLHARIDPVSRKTIIMVDVNLYPERMRALTRGKHKPETNSPRELDLLVEKGLRARLQTGNLLTGQLYVALDFVPEAPRARVDWSSKTPVLPTVPSSLQSLQQTLASIAGKVDRLPFDRIGSNLEQTLASANDLILRLDRSLAPEAASTLAEARKTLQTLDKLLAADAPLQHDTRSAMREVAKAAQAFRVLADYLERHPEALLRGKPEDPP